MKMDIVKLDFTRYFREGFGTQGVADFSFHVENFKDPFAGANSFLHACV